MRPTPHAIGRDSGCRVRRSFNFRFRGSDSDSHGLRKKWSLIIVCVTASVLAVAVAVGPGFGLFVYYIKAKYISPGVANVCSVLPTLAGYPAISTNIVRTQDGFELTLWHLPQDATKPLRPVLILHGLECSSRDWFVGLGEQALPWMLWRAGFDVWLGNNRGNFLSPIQNGDWSWNVTQMADYDLPAMIAGVLDETKAHSLDFIGHSQGSLQALLHLSENHTTSAKVSHLVALAPAVYMTMDNNLWKFLDGISDTRGGWWWKMGTFYQGDFATYEEAMRDQCAVMSIAGGCLRTCAANMGGSYMEGHNGFAPTCGDKFKCIPAATSSENIRMYAVALKAGNFPDSLAAIGRPINFSNLQMPISLAAGTEDKFMKVSDVERVRAQCQQGIVVDLWVLDGGGHMDLVWGTEAPRTVYEPLIRRLSGSGNSSGFGIY